MNKKAIVFPLMVTLAFLSACEVKVNANTNVERSDVRVIEPTKKVETARQNLALGPIDYTDEPSIAIHYYREDGNYNDWGLWLWADGADGREYYFNGIDDYGGVAYYPLSTFNNSTNIGFIVKMNAEAAGGDPWKEREGSSDRFINTEMVQIDDHQAYNIYLLSNANGIYLDAARTRQMDDVLSCEFVTSTSIKVVSKNAIGSIVIKRNGVAASGTGSLSSDKTTYTFNVSGEFNVADLFVAEMVFEASGFAYQKGVSIRKLYDEAFDTKYNYEGALGAIYSATETAFKVWSPVSQSIELRIYDNGTPVAVNASIGSDAYVAYPMVKNNKGVFEYTVTGDLQGKYYTYNVVNSSYPDGKEVVDPYAKSAGVNGLRGMVVDFARTNPTGWSDVDYLDYERNSLTVYETHIAELTCSDTWGGTPENAKKFKGFYETDTTYTKNNVTVKTGFDHIKELGVNAVQIIPFFDQANDETNMTFNWGYNPLNYNVVEGGYSSNPYDGYARIRELKELVQAYNDAGITIIMDVVYNHTSGLKGSNFDVLVPYYYYRYTDEGASNGSGCGNETASDKYMFRKFMIDSTTFWTSEYKLGGFRFDLMGIHDVGTMNELVAKNKLINPNIVIYGEPWAGGTTALPEGMAAAVQANANLFEGYGAFNDRVRDSMISGGLSPTYSRGWVSNDRLSVNPQSVVYGIQGITRGATDDPNKAVTYVTCHDNYTMHDRLRVADYTSTERTVSEYYTEEKIEKTNALAYSIVFTSQGISFMLAGEEMLRTKIIYDENGDPVMAKNKAGETLNIPEVSGNSYNLSYKTNEINYEWKVDHLNLFTSYQKLIAFKQNVAGLHGTTPNAVEILDEGRVIKITIQDNNKTYYVYHRNGVPSSEVKTANALAYVASALTFGLASCSNNSSNEFKVDIKDATLYLDTLQRELSGDSMVLQPFETLIISR